MSTGIADRLAAMTAEQRALLNLRLARRRPAAALQPIPRRADPAAPAPLSFEQERLWFMQQLFPHGAAHNISNAFRFPGEPAVPALLAALALVLERHEILRSSFRLEGERPVQVVMPAGAPPLPTIDLSGLAESAAHVHGVLARCASIPFDLGAELPIRTVLLRAHGESFLLVTLHHIVTDWWSFGIFQREMMTAYAAFSAGRRPAWPPLPVQFADFAAWQREALTADKESAQLAYWQERFAGPPEEFELDTDHPRPETGTFRGARLKLGLPAAASFGFKALLKRFETTPFAAFLAAWAALLSRLRDRGDVLVGTPMSDRSRPETEGVIGYFLNFVVLRLDLAGDPPFSAVAREARDAVRGAYAHQDLPFSRLVDELRLPRSLNRMPLTQASFVYVQAPDDAPLADALAASPVERAALDPGLARVDLTLVLEDAAEGCGGFFEYGTEVFDQVRIARYASAFAALLAGVARDPECPLSALPLFGEAERRQLEGEWNDTAAPPVTERLHDAVARWAVRTPEAPAITDGGQKLTYAELEKAAGRLAGLLARRGVQPGDRVGVAIERSLPAVVALLAVLEAGAAYAWLDPAWPEERLTEMIADAGPALVIGRGEPARRCGWLDLDDLDSGRDDAAVSPPESTVPPEAPAYLLYTSGSTGRPKGVWCHHAGAVGFVEEVERLAPVSPGGAGSLWCSLGFDVSVWEMFSVFRTGGCLHLPPAEARLDGARFAAWMAASGVTSAYVPPALLPGFVEGFASPRLERLLVGVEPIPEDLIQRLLAKAPRLAVVNAYGPTEAAIFATLHHVRPAAAGPEARRLPIGRPIQRARVHLLDRFGGTAPLGVLGEVHLGGPGLALGYFGDPEKTAAAFVPDPFGGPGARLYKTGDLARFGHGGTLVFHARKDRQVKVRGRRAEPGEVEAALRRHPGVRTALVAPWSEGGETHLVAYVVGEGGAPEAGELRSHLVGVLPEYLVPAFFLPVEALPLTPNGKIDWKALPRPGMAAGHVAPRNATEEALAGLWQELLGVPRVGIHDNFFALGGHSLLAHRILAWVADRFGVELPLRALFERPTIADFAVAVVEGRAALEDPREMAALLAEIEALPDA